MTWRRSEACIVAVELMNEMCWWKELLRGMRGQVKRMKKARRPLRIGQRSYIRFWAGQKQEHQDMERRAAQCGSYRRSDMPESSKSSSVDTSGVNNVALLTMQRCSQD